MFKSLYAKFALAFVSLAFFTAAIVALFIRLTSEDRLSKLITEQQVSSLQTALADYYSAAGSWQGVAQAWHEIESGTRLGGYAGNEPAPPEGDKQPGDDKHDDFKDRSLFGLADAQGVVLVPVNRDTPLGATLPASLLKQGNPVTVNGETVGTILTVKNLPAFNPEEALFLQRTNQALGLAVAGSLIAALVIGVLLARTLTRPLKALTQAAEGIAGGELQQEVKIQSRDEIGKLAAAFNRMSAEVARVHQARKQMTADIAHDLRTPLTVIGGYVESMRDGVLAPTPQRLATIYAEIERMQDLVGDLRMLSQVDAGELPLNPQPAAPDALLQRAAELFQHQAAQLNVALKLQAEPNLPEVLVDEARMMQVLDNLLSNALRYTPAGGSITLSANAAGGRVQLAVADTGIGIEPQELPLIFERFHRADKSRHAENGESGLGLAIVKALVEAHGGRVWAESVPGQGTTLRLELPGL